VEWEVELPTELVGLEVVPMVPLELHHSVKVAVAQHNFLAVMAVHLGQD
jgi:hypothetical protein